MGKRGAGGVHADDVVVFLAWTMAIGLVLAAAFGARLLIDPVRRSIERAQLSELSEPGGAAASVELGLLYPVHGPVPNETEMRNAAVFDMGQASQPALEPPGAVVVKAAWREQPRPVYPGAAAYADVEGGRVQLECFVRADGLIAACSVLDETPPGYGFGRAAIAATYDARLQPRSVDGVTTAGRVRFNTSFILR